MKKTLFVIGFIVVLSLTGCDNENNPTNATVSQAHSMRDGVYVRISGEIVSQLGREWYIFRDHTGEITVEIEDEVWFRNGLTPNIALPARFEIVGEVDRESGQPTIIEVERLRRI